MFDFAIIAEGVTDQIVLREILLGAFTDWPEEPTVNFVQPLQDTTGHRTAPSPGGFDQVIKFLQCGRHREALQLNRYLIIQLDTDVCDRYGVASRVDGQELDVGALIEQVILRLRALIGDELCESHGDRFLFAIAVHEIECWLLPLCFDRSQKQKRAKLSGCREAANHALALDRQPPLSAGDGKEQRKDPSAYARLARAYSRPRTLKECGGANPSLSVFLRSLAERRILPGP